MSNINLFLRIKTADRCTYIISSVEMRTVNSKYFLLLLLFFISFFNIDYKVLIFQPNFKTAKKFFQFHFNYITFRFLEFVQIFIQL